MANSPVDLSFLRSPASQRRIVLIAVGCSVLGALWGLFGPRWYSSSVTVVPAAPQKSSRIAGLLGGELGGLAAGFGASVGSGADVARIAAVLQSVAVSDAVIEKFDLRSRYDAGSQEGAREALWKHCDVRAQPKPGLVQLSCEDRDPRFVQALLRYFADFGNQVFRRVNVGTASEEVKFLERRVAELRVQADESASRMREFQEKHQIVDLESQAKAVVASVAALNSERIARQMELDYTRNYSSSDEPRARQLESRLSVVDESLRDLERPRGPATEQGVATRPQGRRAPGMLPAALAVPALRAEFEKLYRDRKVAEATLVFALDRLEGARASEARDVSTFVVLDPPPLPTRRSRPKTLDSALRGGALGLAIALGLGLIESWVNARRKGVRP